MAPASMRLLLLGGLAIPVDSFVATTPNNRQRQRQPIPSKTRLAIFDPSTTFHTAAVEVFDGSTVDSVVVSDAFWNGLQTRIISVIIGQLLAAFVFGIVSTIAATQFNRISEWVSKEIFNEENVDRAVNGVNQGISTAGDEVQKRVSSVPEADFSKLAVCILIDLIGTSSELIPILGELTDVAYAPIAGLVLRSLFGSNILFALEFTEEILPLTDILPLATICWVVDTYFGDTAIAKSLGLGNYNSRKVIDEDAIDVPSQQDIEQRRLPGDDMRR